MADNKVSEMISEVSKNFRGMIDANAVVGEAIEVGDGTVIVPISKVTFGFGGGGSDFDGKTDIHFGGGMGGGAKVNAEAFLVINNGNVRLIPMGGSTSAVDKIIDLMPGVIDKINGFIASRKDKKKEDSEDNPEEIVFDEIIGEDI